MAAGIIRERGGRKLVEPVDRLSPYVHNPFHIGIIGGSGLYDMAELTDREERVVTTPFGDPSGPYVAGDAARPARRVSRAARRTATGCCRRS